MSNKDRKRISEIIHRLSWLSIGGWKNASPEEYLPLERELKQLQSKAQNARRQELAKHRATHSTAA